MEQGNRTNQRAVKARWNQQGRAFKNILKMGLCAQAVPTQPRFNSDEQPELFRASSASTGGTLLMGRTCSAFTAGVMAIGLSTGEIENSFPRVARMLAIMTAGGNAFDEKINKFNCGMNLGFRLSR